MTDQTQSNAAESIPLDYASVPKVVPIQWSRVAAKLLLVVFGIGVLFFLFCGGIFILAACDSKGGLALTMLAIGAILFGGAIGCFYIMRHFGRMISSDGSSRTSKRVG